MIRQPTAAGHGQRTDCTTLSMIPYIGRKQRFCISPGAKKMIFFRYGFSKLRFLKKKLFPICEISFIVNKKVIVSHLYETHLHTTNSSACANSKGSEYIWIYKEMGYSGIIVTDHFYNGNTAIPRNLPWKEWVKHFCRGYEEALNEGERMDFKVFFGWEETFDGCDDYLVYGLDKEWLMEHPEARTWTRAEQYHAVKAAGGCVVQAHPFRQHYYIHKLILSAGCVDAIEAANAGNTEQSYDALAMRYAQKLRLPVTAGSDIHDARLISEDCLYGVVLDKELNTIDDYVSAIRNNTIIGISACEHRCDYSGNETVRIPLDIRDRNDMSTGKSWEEFLEGDLI